MAAVLLVLVLVAAGCGSGPAAQKIERTFDVHWSDRASEEAVLYTARNLDFHDGKWSADVTVTNKTQTPLYETEWTSPGSKWSSWNGPALVYSGKDVLGNRRLIYIPASTETPAIPFPLRPGQTWTGKVEGHLPAKPLIPHGQLIWLRYPMFGIGQPWDGFNAATAVQWISQKGVTL